MFFALAFPVFDPVLFSIGPLAIRWYSLAYLGGGLIVVLHLYVFRHLPTALRATDFRLYDFFTYGLLGVILGGRLGYVVFYHPLYYFYHPFDAFALWEGGMSFHGGFIGLVVALFLFSRRFSVPYWSLMDAVAAGIPPALFLGRLANFVNGELYGRPTTVPWGMIFPQGGSIPRHPSQLYEALGEGLFLWIILLIAYAFGHRRTGLVSGLFCIFYACIRFGIEFFRMPDAHISFFFGVLTMGQLLCMALFVLGICLIVYHRMGRRL